MLAELIGVIGEHATVALLRRFAGTRLFVPTTIRPDHLIVEAIGWEAAQKLSAHYSPDYMHVPLGRELRAKHLREDGYSHASIAVELGLTEGGVQRLLHRIGL